MATSIATSYDLVAEPQDQSSGRPATLRLRFDKALLGRRASKDFQIDLNTCKALDDGDEADVTSVGRDARWSASGDPR